MAKVKAEDYLELVKRSELVDQERLDQAVSGLQQPISDSGIIGSTLIKAGLLTEWQNEKLLAGRYKGFFLGKYKILDHLGTGGMSSVYLAEHKVMKHRVAIKVLPKNLVQQSSYLERFHQEARAAALLDHPNMVRAYDVDNDRDQHFLVMEYVDGVDVKELVARDGPLPYRTSAEYTRQAADGLAYAHSRGLVHRDIKPANLLIDKGGTVKILDLGLVRFSDDVKGSLTVAYDENMIGTVDYLAPEQAVNSHKADGRADIYSLGCTLYFMLTGGPPFPEGTIPQRVMMHQNSEPPAIRKVRPDAPDALIKTCSRMMAKSPERRFQSAAEVSRVLTEFLSGGSDVLGGNSGIVRRTGPGMSGIRSMTPPPQPQSQPIGGQADDDDLGLAPLDDDPAPKMPASAKAKPKPDSTRPAGAPVKSVPGNAAPEQELELERSASGSDSSKRRTATPVAAKPATPRAAPAAARVVPPARSAADDLDDLLGPSAAAASQAPDWSSGAGAPMYYQSGSTGDNIWKLIGVGLLVGLVLIALGFGLWRFMGY